jgi:hypothetical protein
VTYTVGATDGGCSGGPAVDAATLRVVGVLSGGFAACAPRAGGADYVATLASAFRAGLDAFLDASASPGGRALGGGGVVGFSPAALLVDAAAAAAPFDVFLTAPLADDSAGLRVTFDVVALPGTPRTADPRAAVGLDPPSIVLTRATPSASVRLVDRRPGRPLPDGLGRLYVVARVEAVPAAAAPAPDVAAASAAAAPAPSAPPDARLKVVVMRTPRSGLSAALPVSGGLTPPVTLRAQLRTASGKAAFRFDAPPAAAPTTLWDVRLCLMAPSLADAAVAVYVNGSLARLVNGGAPSRPRSPPADPACVDVPSVAVPPSMILDVVVSDASFLDAVLPVSSVQSLALVRGRQ